MKVNFWILCMVDGTNNKVNLPLNVTKTINTANRQKNNDFLLCFVRKRSKLANYPL